MDFSKSSRVLMVDMHLKDAWWVDSAQMILLPVKQVVIFMSPLLQWIPTKYTELFDRWTYFLWPLVGCRNFC